MLSSRPYCRVARLEEAASQAQRRAARRPALVSLVEPSSATIPDLWCMHEVWGLRPDVSKRRCSSKLGRASSSKSQCQPSARLAYVHARSSRTRHGGILTIRYGRDDQQICSRCRKPQNTSTANHWLAKLNRHAVAAINNHDARRDDSRKAPGKDVKRLRTPTARTEVRVVSREGVQSRS